MVYCWGISISFYQIPYPWPPRWARATCPPLWTAWAGSPGHKRTARATWPASGPPSPAYWCQEPGGGLNQSVAPQVAEVAPAWPPVQLPRPPGGPQPPLHRWVYGALVAILSVYCSQVFICIQYFSLNYIQSFRCLSPLPNNHLITIHNSLFLTSHLHSLQFSLSVSPSRRPSGDTDTWRLDVIIVYMVSQWFPPQPACTRSCPALWRRPSETDTQAPGLGWVPRSEWSNKDSSRSWQSCIIIRNTHSANICSGHSDLLQNVSQLRMAIPQLSLLPWQHWRRGQEAEHHWPEMSQ